MMSCLIFYKEIQIQCFQWLTKPQIKQILQGAETSRRQNHHSSYEQIKVPDITHENDVDG